MTAVEMHAREQGGGFGARHPWLASVAIEAQDVRGWFYVYTHRTPKGWATKELRLLNSGKGVVTTRVRYFRDKPHALAIRSRWAGLDEC